MLKFPNPEINNSPLGTEKLAAGRRRCWRKLRIASYIFVFLGANGLIQ